MLFGIVSIKGFALEASKPEEGFYDITELEIPEFKISTRLANWFLSHKKLENKLH